MKMSEAEGIIRSPDTYIVAFDVRENGVFRADHFPDVIRGEPGIISESYAWDLAQQFAAHKPNVVNVMVCTASNFQPVPGYRTKIINEYRPSK